MKAQTKKELVEKHPAEGLQDFTAGRVSPAFRSVGEFKAYLKAKKTRPYSPTPRELRAIEKGRAEIRRGDYYTLPELEKSLLGNQQKKRR